MRKAQFWPATFTGKLILAIIFTTASIFIVREIAEAATTGYDKALCKSTVLANARFRFPGAQIQQIKVSCPTRFVTVGLDEIIMESDGDKQKIDINCKKGLFKKGTENTPESKKCFLNKTNSVIANLIFDCWDQFGAGFLRVFSNYVINRQCIICSRIEFKQEVYELFEEDVGASPISLTKFRGDTPETDFTLDNYMRSHNPRLHTITFYEFTLDQADVFLYPYYDYTLDKSWAAVFVAQNEHALKQLLIEAWDEFKAWWTETQPPEKEFFVNTLEFEPYDEVVEVCDVLV